MKAKEIKDIMTVETTKFSNGNKGEWPHIGGEALSDEYIAFLREELGMDLCYKGRIFRNSKQLNRVWKTAEKVAKGLKALENAPEVEATYDFEE